MSEVSDYDYNDDYNYEVYDREDPWVDPRDNQSMEDNIYDRVIEKFTLEFNAMKKLLEDERELRTAQVTELQVKLTQVQSENKKLLQSIDILESKRRKNNVIIFGVDEQDNGESPGTTVENICEQLDVDISPGMISDAYRVGRNKGKRPIVCTVSSFRKKTEIMQKNKAKGQFAILHDLTKKERREKKELKGRLDEARSRGYHAYIRHGNLIVEGQTFTRDDLLGNAAIPLTEEKKGDTQRENAAALHSPTNPDIAPAQMATVSPELPDRSAPLAVTSPKKTVTPMKQERMLSVKRAANAGQTTATVRRNLPSKQPASAVGGKQVITAPLTATKNKAKISPPPLNSKKNKNNN